MSGRFPLAPFVLLGRGPFLGCPFRSFSDFFVLGSTLPSGSLPMLPRPGPPPGDRFYCGCKTCLKKDKPWVSQATWYQHRKFRELQQSQGEIPPADPRHAVPTQSAAKERRRAELYGTLTGMLYSSMCVDICLISVLYRFRYLRIDGWPIHWDLSAAGKSWRSIRGSYPPRLQYIERT